MFFIPCNNWNTFIFLKVCCYLLHVLVMSRTRFRVNPHFIASWMSRNSLREVGAKYENKVTATGLESRTTWVFFLLSGSGFESSYSHLSLLLLWDFFNRHIVVFFKRRVLKEVHILHYLHSKSTVLIPKFKNVAILYHTFTWYTFRS